MKSKHMNVKKIPYLLATTLLVSCGENSHFTSINAVTSTNTPIAQISLIQNDSLGTALNIKTNHIYNDNETGASNRATEWFISVNNAEVAQIGLKENTQALYSLGGMSTTSLQGDLQIQNLSLLLNNLGYATSLSNGDVVCFSANVRNGEGVLSPVRSTPVCQNITIPFCNNKPNPALSFNEVGDGSIGSPYEIWTADQFVSFLYDSDRSLNFIQCDNIDFQSYYDNGGKEFRTKDFTGVYDGQNYLLNNIRHTEENSDQNLFLFDYVSGTLKNMSLPNGVFSGTNGMTFTSIARSATNATFQNIYIQYNANFITLSSGAAVALYCEKCTLDQVSSNGNISSGVIAQFGGLTQYNTATSISNSHSLLNLEAETYETLGGLVYRINQGAISKSSSRIQAKQKDLGLGQISASKSYLCGLAFEISEKSNVDQSYAHLNYQQEINIYIHGIDGFVGNLTDSQVTNSYGKTDATIISDQFVETTGFGGHVNNSTLQNVYGNYTLNSTTTQYSPAGYQYHGGLIAEGGSPSILTDVFAVTKATFADPLVGTEIARAVAPATATSDLSSTYYSNDTSCTGCGLNGIGVPLSQLYSPNNAPLSNWDFNTIWKENSNELPTLLQNPEL